MEEALNKLIAVGALEISKTTHISVAKIESILTKDFGKLDWVGAIGFIHILEREYKVDLSEWIEEFKTFHESNGDGERSESDVVKTSFVSKKEEVAKDKKGGGGKFWLILLLLILLGAAGYYFLDWKKMLADVQGFAQTQGVVEPGSETVEIQEVETLVPEQTESAKEAEMQTDANVSETLSVVESDELIESVPVAENNATQPEGFYPVEVDLGKDGNASSEQPVQNNALSFSINPTGKLWLGIVDIENSQKSNIIISSPKDFNITEPLLILTGHGNFSITEDNKTNDYSGVNPVRLKVSPQEGVKVITLDEFKALNGGKSW